MGAAQDAFKLMLRERIAPALRAMGFRGSGQEYSLPSDTHWSLLGFQRSMYSDRYSIRFTLSMTVVRRDAWDEARLERDWIGAKPQALVGGFGGIRSFWNERLGVLLPVGKDYWWTLNADDDPSALAAEIVAAIRDYALPAMREHMK